MIHIKYSFTSLGMSVASFSAPSHTLIFLNQRNLVLYRLSHTYTSLSAKPVTEDISL